MKVATTKCTFSRPRVRFRKVNTDDEIAAFEAGLTDSGLNLADARETVWDGGEARLLCNNSVFDGR